MLWAYTNHLQLFLNLFDICYAASPSGSAIIFLPRANDMKISAKGAKIAGAKVTQGRTVEVKETVMAPHFVSKLSDVVSRPGQTVKFMADVGGDPEPSVAWLFKGKPLHAGRDVKVG